MPRNRYRPPYTQIRISDLGSKTSFFFFFAFFVFLNGFCMFEGAEALREAHSGLCHAGYGISSDHEDHKTCSVLHRTIDRHISAHESYISHLCMNNEAFCFHTPGANVPSRSHDIKFHLATAGMTRKTGQDGDSRLSLLFINLDARVFDSLAQSLHSLCKHLR